jgi:hypothetical protein
MYVAHAESGESDILRRRLAPLLVALTLLIGSWSVTGAYAAEPEDAGEDGITEADPSVDPGSADEAGESPDQADELPPPDSVAVSEPGGPLDGTKELRTVEATVHNIAVENEAIPGFGDPMPVVTAVEFDGQLFEMPAEQTSTLATGDIVEVTFSADADLTLAESLELATDGEGATVLAVEETGESSDEFVLAEGSVAHALTVLPVYWSTGPSVTTASLQNLVTSTDQFWRDQSGGQLTISPVSVRNWVQVSAPPSCDVQSMLDLLTRARNANGVGSPSATNHVVVFFPQWSSCGWSGMASVGGGMIWINGTLVPDVLAHEYGHNLGLGHANTMTCTSSGSRVPLVLPLSNCRAIEYRDYADVMGIGMSNKPTGNLNTALADHLGFVALTDVTNSSGVTKDLAPLGQVSGHRALRMSIPGGQLYVDYRPATGRDTRWSGWAGVQVHIKTLDSRGIPISYLLNMQTGSGDFTTPSTVRPQLPAGQSWQLPGVDRAVTVNSVGSTARVTVGVSPISRYIEQVYQDLFERSVDPSGLQTWRNALMNGTPRVAVANSITYSTEYRTRLITASYNYYLGRDPDPGGLQNWLSMMKQGWTIQRMESGFLASTEYYVKAGGSDPEWVEQLYSHVLGRDASPSEILFWTQALRSGQNRAQVAMGFLLSTEHLTSVVDEYYVELLGRHIDPSGKYTWVSRIQAGVRVEAIIGGIVASAEYYSKV